MHIPSYLHQVLKLHLQSHQIIERLSEKSSVHQHPRSFLSLRRKNGRTGHSKLEGKRKQNTPILSVLPNHVYLTNHYIKKVYFLCVHSFLKRSILICFIYQYSLHLHLPLSPSFSTASLSLMHKHCT